jgi:hypothetical protein
MKLQGASVLDLITELLIRLDAMGKLEQLEQLAPALRVVLEDQGIEAVEVFTRMLGADHGATKAAAVTAAPKARRS